MQDDRGAFVKKEKRHRQRLCADGGRGAAYHPVL